MDRYTDPKRRHGNIAEGFKLVSKAGGKEGKGSVWVRQNRDDRRVRHRYKELIEQAKVLGLN